MTGNYHAISTCKFHTQPPFVSSIVGLSTLQKLTWGREPVATSVECIMGQAAVASLVIVAVGMLPVMLLTRTMRIRIAPVSPVAAGSQTRPATA